MFASQLLRILESIPGDVKYEPCVFDSAKQDKTMKENQEITYDANSFGREADRPECKETYQFDGSPNDTSTLAFDVKGGVARWNPFMDDFLGDDENGIGDSHVGSLEKDADTLFSDTNKENGQEQVHSSNREELEHCYENESGKSSLSCLANSDLRETETNMYTDKNVLESEPPELQVCYAEMNYHVVKDICVDEGLPVKDKILDESYKPADHDHYYSSLPDNINQYEAAHGGINMEFFKSDESATSLVEKPKSVGEDEPKSKDESHGNSIAQSLPEELPPGSCVDADAKKNNNSEMSVQHTGETNLETVGNTVTSSSNTESFVDKILPIEEYGTRSFLRSFISSLDSQEHKISQPCDQLPSGKEVYESVAVAMEAESKEDVQASSLQDDTEVEKGSITFHFNSPPLNKCGAPTGKTAVVNDQSVDSANVHINDDCTGNSHEQPPNSKDEHSVDSSAASQVQSVSTNEQTDKGADEQSSVHDNGIPKDVSANSQVQIQNDPNIDEQVVKPNVSNHDPGNSGNASVVNYLQRDAGESSFSAAGLITYSGPIAYSGSLSIRSDGSTTSTRSFAFPVLQNEWNSSPVRMAKADRRDFRKHKCWRSGLLCCRF